MPCHSSPPPLPMEFTDRSAWERTARCRAPPPLTSPSPALETRAVVLSWKVAGGEGAEWVFFDDWKLGTRGAPELL